jgi:hypothetical protein
LSCIKPLQHDGAMTATQHQDCTNSPRHFWRTRSTHTTSEGLVTYQSCACGRWRIVTAGWDAEIASPK